jgi:hypothetical protein
MFNALDASFKTFVGRFNVLEDRFNALNRRFKTLEMSFNVRKRSPPPLARRVQRQTETINHWPHIMPNYDTPGLNYDSGALYGDEVPGPQTINTNMARVKFTLKNTPDLEVIQACNNLKTALTGNATFPTPPVTLTAFGTAITAAQTKLTAADNAQATAKQATTDKDTAIATLTALAMQIVGYVDTTAAGDASKILSAGLSVRAAKSPKPVPGQVQNLSLTAGDNGGVLDAHWDSLRGAKSFEVQVKLEPMTATSFVTADTVTRSSATLRGLTSGTRVWVRVRAINSAGKGAWSDPATKIVP